ncbi:hypothetical protein [Burkholderia glumae]|uniref:hypothetical protein n=1 Tax=Burkholderia glumae TaxID=337 RepID=UPI0021516624|nr:hypothetical protein [Burkholderia glumae]
MNAVSPFPKHSNALVNAFSDAELVLIFKIHTLVPPADLLALIHAQRLADRRDTAVPPTLEQLLRTLATLAKPARAQDWGDLRHLIEGAWLVGALDELSPRVIATVQALIMRGESHRDWPLDEAALENGASLARVESQVRHGSDAVVGYEAQHRHEQNKCANQGNPPLSLEVAEQIISSVPRTLDRDSGSQEPATASCSTESTLVATKSEHTGEAAQAATHPIRDRLLRNGCGERT